MRDVLSKYEKCVIHFRSKFTLDSIVNIEAKSGQNLNLIIFYSHLHHFYWHTHRWHEHFSDSFCIYGHHWFPLNRHEIAEMKASSITMSSSLWFLPSWTIISSMFCAVLSLLHRVICFFLLYCLNVFYYFFHLFLKS